MNIEYVVEYRDIMVEADTLRRHADFLKDKPSLADYRKRLLEKAEVCEAQCLSADAYIKRLPEPKRSIIILSCCKGMKPAAVAAEVGMDSRKVQRLTKAALDLLAAM